MAIIMFFCWYYPVGFYQNAEPTNTVHERGALFFLLVWSFLIFTSTFAHMVIAAVETAETGGNIANLMFSLVLIFCGVLATRISLPGFWQFMYYLSPFTWLVSAFLSTGLANTSVTCASYEYSVFTPPSGQTCEEYMAPYGRANGGYLGPATNATTCSWCSLSSTNTFLASVGSNYSDRWRNFGIIFGYIFFNTFMALFLYWLVRVPKKAAKTKEVSSDGENTDHKSLSQQSSSSLETPVAAAGKSKEFGSDANTGLAAEKSQSHLASNHAAVPNQQERTLEPIRSGPTSPEPTRDGFTSTSTTSNLESNKAAPALLDLNAVIGHSHHNPPNDGPGTTAEILLDEKAHRAAHQV